MTPEASPVPRVSRPARDPGAPGAGRSRRLRPLVWLGRALVGLGCSALLGWMALAIYLDFSLLGPPWLRAGLGALVPVGAMIALLLVRPLRWVLAGILGAFVVVLAAWLAIPPSNARDWQPDVMTLPFADIDGDRVLVHNVRNAEYRSETDYTVRLEDRALDLSKLRTLDLFLIYWGSPLIAHTIMSWGFEGDQYLAISIETRKEKGEEYSALRGFFRQYELVFVVADERDVVRLRTNVRGEDVYVYRLDVSPADARVLLLRYLEEVNRLRERPQWYNALTGNCTTAIQRLARSGARRSWWSWKLFVNGYIDELAYDIGAIDRSLPFFTSQGEKPCQRTGQGRRRGPTLLGPDPGRAPADVTGPRQCRRNTMRPTQHCRLLLLGALCLALAACAGPLGTVRVDPKVVHYDLARSAVTTGEPSAPTRNVLFERGLFKAFDAHPEDVIAELHRTMVAAGGDQDLLFALAELSFLHGRAAKKVEYDLAALVYAYAFLFPEGDEGAPGRFDPRLRIAADLYNWALTAAFASKDGSEVVPRGGTFELPFGRMEVAFDSAALRAGDRELYRFIPIAELKVHGLAMRYRWPGLGAPLAASTRPIDSSTPGRDMVAPRLQVPLTALLRISEARRALVREQPLTGTLELHLSWDAESVSIAGEQVPLETIRRQRWRARSPTCRLCSWRSSGSLADSPG